jgi:hypothetical protein
VARSTDEIDLKVYETTPLMARGPAQLPFDLLLQLVARPCTSK